MSIPTPYTIFQGGNLYFARELYSHFYLDLQGTLDYSSDPVRNGKESRWLGMAGIGFTVASR